VGSNWHDGEWRKNNTDPQGLGQRAPRVYSATRHCPGLKRPELGALSGAILIYIIFYFLAGDSGMFTLKGIIEILQVSAEIGSWRRPHRC